MTGDDLSQPLGLDRTAHAEAPAGRLAPLILGAAGLVAIGAISWLIIRSDPLGGEPHARARIERIQAAPAQQAEKKQEPAGEAKTRETASEVEAGSGVKVTRGQGGTAPGALILKVPDDPTAGAAIKLAPVDRRLLERGRHGQLPKAAADAGKPREVYARPFEQGAGQGKPAIAVMVTGLGIGQAATNEAIGKLPGEVSLAFAPYGTDLERQAAKARDDGHELFLQVPMEPFDYPDNDPGPQTLLSEAAEAQNLDRLHWLMGRFQGYIGLTNFMGAKFTASRTALKPVFDDVARRGLMFVDDGSSGRSQATPAAAASGLPSLRGDVVLDGLDKPADIEAALIRAEAAARSGGVALVVGPALPLTVDRLGRWLKTLEQKGLILVPVSAASRLKRS